MLHCLDSGVAAFWLLLSRALNSAYNNYFTPTYIGCSPDHDCKPNVVRVDETSISIHCSLVCLPGVPVSWFNDTNDLLPDKTSDLAVRNRGVQAVGGKCYRCQCKNLSHAIESECHQIWG